MYIYIYIYIHMKSVMHNDTQTHIFVSPSLHRSVCLPIYLSIYLQIPPNIPIATLGSNSKEQTPLIGRTESCNSAYHWVHGIYILCILGGWNFEGLLGGLENLCACCANLAGWNWWFGRLIAWHVLWGNVTKTELLQSMIFPISNFRSHGFVFLLALPLWPDWKTYILC